MVLVFDATLGFAKERSKAPAVSAFGVEGEVPFLMLLLLLAAESMALLQNPKSSTVS